MLLIFLIQININNKRSFESTKTKCKNNQSQGPKVTITEPDLDQGIKTQYVYAATIDAGQIYTDQTCRFPVVSSKGHKYIMILYDYDSNVNTSGKAGAQIPQLPLGDDSTPWGR
jgi:hypothetical protein